VTAVGRWWLVQRGHVVRSGVRAAALSRRGGRGGAAAGCGTAQLGRNRESSPDRAVPCVQPTTRRVALDSPREARSLKALNMGDRHGGIGRQCSEPGARRAPGGDRLDARAVRPRRQPLDLTDPEPLPDGHPLWTQDNVLITPHSANSESLLLPALAGRVRANTQRFLAGRQYRDDQARCVGRLAQSAVPHRPACRKDQYWITSGNEGNSNAFRSGPVVGQLTAVSAPRS
jgi:hypothetical protein